VIEEVAQKAVTDKGDRRLFLRSIPTRSRPRHILVTVPEASPRAGGGARPRGDRSSARGRRISPPRPRALGRPLPRRRGLPRLSPTT
jgi:hypothetical protein